MSSFGPSEITETRRHLHLAVIPLPTTFSILLPLCLHPNISAMLSRSFFRAAAQGTRQSGLSKAASLAGAPCASSTLPVQGRRSISVYGYTQSKALVYSKYGEPKDVLR